MICFYHRIFFSLSNYNTRTLYFNLTDFSIFSNVWIHIHRSSNDQSINQKTTPTMAGDRRWPGVKALDNLTWGTLFTWGKKGVGWIMTNDVLCFKDLTTGYPIKSRRDYTGPKKWTALNLVYKYGASTWSHHKTLSFGLPLGLPLLLRIYALTLDLPWPSPVTTRL